MERFRIEPEHLAFGVLGLVALTLVGVMLGAVLFEQCYFVTGKEVNTQRIVTVEVCE